MQKVDLCRESAFYELCVESCVLEMVVILVRAVLKTQPCEHDVRARPCFQYGKFDLVLKLYGFRAECCADFVRIVCVWMLC